MDQYVELRTFFNKTYLFELVTKIEANILFIKNLGNPKTNQSWKKNLRKPKTEVISCRPRLDFFAEDFELLVITKKTAARKAILIATVPEKVRCQKLGAQVRVGLFFEKKLEHLKFN